jgi:hypothetical protein
MAQGEDENLLASVVDDICAAILVSAQGVDDRDPGPFRLRAVQAAE